MAVRLAKKDYKNAAFLQQRNIQRDRLHHKTRGSFLSAGHFTRAEKRIGSISHAAYSAGRSNAHVVHKEI